MALQTERPDDSVAQLSANELSIKFYRQRLHQLEAVDSSGQLSDKKEVLHDYYFGDHVIESLRQLYDEGLLCDFTLVADGKKFKVHKALLASVSPYFKAMLTGSMLESKAEEVELRGVSAEGLAPLIKYLYCGKINITENTIAEVLSSASHLQILSAITLCEEFLQLNLTPTNCVEFLELAELFSLRNVKSSIEDYVTLHFAEVCQCGQQGKIPFKLMLDCTQSTEFTCLSEYELYCWIKQWVEFDLKDRIKYAVVLLEHVKFPLMKTEELEGIKRTASFVTENDVCCQYLEDALIYHQVTPHVQFSMQTPQTQLRSHPSLVCFAGDLENGPGCSKHMYMFTVGTHEKEMWKKLPDTPVTFSQASTVVLSDYLFVCGGFVADREITNRCYAFDPRFWRWFPIMSMNNKRINFPLVHFSGYIYAFGGCWQKKPLYCNLSTVERYSMDTNQWEVVCEMSEKLRRHASCVFQDNIYIAGGLRENIMASNRLETFNPQTRTWTQKSPMLGVHFDHFLVAFNDKLCMLDGNMLEIEIYCPVSDQWTLVINHGMALAVPFSASVLEFGMFGGNRVLFLAGKMSLDEDEELEALNRDGGYEGGACTSFNLESMDEDSHMQWRYPERVLFPHGCMIRLPQGVGEGILESTE